MKNYFLAFTFLASIVAINLSTAEALVLQPNATVVQVGEAKVTLLSEGASERKPDLLLNASTADIQKYIPTGSYPTAINAFLVETSGQTVLIDTGFGRASFYSYLNAAKVKPENINAILLTHMHKDHISGLLTADGNIAFPNATIYVSAKEYDYWKDRDEGVILARYGDKVQTFEPNELGAAVSPLFPNIFPIAAYGHTPGHTMYLIQSGNDQLLIWGDLVHAAAIQFPLPDVALTFDVDPVEAIRTRKAVFAYVAANHIPVAGMHLPLPGLGIVENEPNSDGYRFTPLGK